MSQSRIAISRIERFLALPEISSDEKQKATKDSLQEKNALIELKECDYAWNPKFDVVLKHISVTIPKKLIDCNYWANRIFDCLEKRLNERNC